MNAELPFSTVIRYEPRHYAEIRPWYEGRDVGVPPDLLPPTGFYVEGKAVAFLYKTDGGFALIESIAANPAILPAERSAALDAVVEAVGVEAKRQGFKVLVGQTKLSAVVERAKRHGYLLYPETYRLVIKRLD